MAGEPGEPLTYLSQDFADAIPGTSGPAKDYPSAALGDPRNSPDAAVVKALRAYVLTMPAEGAVARMAPDTYDHDWAGPGLPDASETFLTSSQCMACHDAGGTGLQFDMTMPNPHGKGLLDLSQYATWRSSPMGLAGRDPIFFAQLASETQTFHPRSADLVESTCLGCHGIAGARQFQIDEHAKTGACPTFTRDLVDAVPWPSGNPGAEHADYGMLARDGVTCTACHRMALTEAAMAKAAGAAENACIAERQAVLNPENTGFARTVTGSFLVGGPEAILGPFESPKTIPMENIARHDPGPRCGDHELGGLRELPHRASANPQGRPTPRPASTSRPPIRNGRSAPTAPARRRMATCRSAPARSASPARTATCRTRTTTASFAPARSPAS